jgi:8-amino-7-oxononanoate synthase
MFPEKLYKKLDDRADNNSLRSLAKQSSLIDFSSNDYLGFAKSKAIFNNTHEYLVKESYTHNGATGSRLLSGNYNLYSIVEQQLKEIHLSEALLFNSGYDANLGFFSAVPQRHDIILYDEFSHASIRDGIRLSSAKAFAFKHNDIEDLEEKLKKYSINNDVYMVTESVFSMDGDSPDLIKLCYVCKKYKANVIIDEAHALGVFSYGLIQKLDLVDQVFARIMTFGKAMGCHGAAILGCCKLKEYLINFSRSFIYTTGLSPHSIATIKIAYEYFETDDLELYKLHENIQYFKNKCLKLHLNSLFVDNVSAIQSCVIPGNSVVKNIANMMQLNGFNVKPILSPTVPEGQERLRFCIHSYNTHGQIDEVLNLLSTFVND